MWIPLLDKLRSRVEKWKGGFLSMGGRITLLIYVLCSLSIFLFSFFEVHVKILRDIEKIQQSFVWRNS